MYIRTIIPIKPVFKNQYYWYFSVYNRFSPELVIIVNIQQAELDDARDGTLYFLSKLDMVSSPGFDLGLVGNFVGNTTVITDLKNATTTLISSCDAGKKVLDGIDQYTKPIRVLLSNFMDALVDRITSIYGEGSAALEWVGEFGSWAISTLIGSLADIIPGWGYVQSALDLYEGIKKSVTSAIKWLGQVYSGWGVELLAGGPSIMAEALARHNATSLAHGLKDMAVESVKIGLQAAGDAAAGVGAIVGAVTGVLQRIANLVGYCVQRFMVNRALNQAANQWNLKGIYMQDRQQFTEWFKQVCICTPVIAALTLSSGMVGHQYRFLSLINDSDEVIDQAAFDAGTKHIDKLKELSASYLNQYQDSYKVLFRSEDTLVSNRLQDVLKEV